MTQQLIRRWAWLGTFVIGAGLYLAVLAVLTDTGNPNLFPTMILLGAIVVPLTFVTFADGRSGRWLIDGPTLGGCLLFGGVVGVVVAGLLEYKAMRRLGTLPMVGVGLIEEAAKLIVPVILVVFFGTPVPDLDRPRDRHRGRGRHRVRRTGDDGLRVRRAAAVERECRGRRADAVHPRPAVTGRTRRLDRADLLGSVAVRDRAVRSAPRLLPRHVRAWPSPCTPPGTASAAGSRTSSSGRSPSACCSTASSAPSAATLDKLSKLDLLSQRDT